MTALIVGACTFLSGCGSEYSSFVPVTGTVTLAGEPVEGVVVRFVPLGIAEGSDSRSYSFGRTDAEGRYSLRIAREPGLSGATVGRHKVLFDNVPGRDTTISEETGETSTSALVARFEVPESGTSNADFELSDLLDGA